MKKRCGNCAHEKVSGKKHPCNKCIEHGWNDKETLDYWSPKEKKPSTPTKAKATYVLALDTVEQERYEAFYAEHYKKHKCGCCPVTLTPTGIGVHVEVNCPKCGKKEDISNYECW